MLFGMHLFVLLLILTSFSVVADPPSRNELNSFPLWVTYRTAHVCQTLVRLPSNGPSLLVLPVKKSLAGGELRHVSRSWLDRLERQTAPRFLNAACTGDEPDAIAIAAETFSVEGQAEGRTGNAAAIAKWIATLGIKPSQLTARIKDPSDRSQTLLAVFGWGHAIALPCFENDVAVPDQLWIQRDGAPAELIWVVASEPANWRTDRIASIRPPTSLPLPACVLKQPTKTYRALADSARKSASESALVEYAGDAGRCDRCPVEPLRENEWEALVRVKMIPRSSNARDLNLFRLRWSTPVPGAFEGFRLVPVNERAAFVAEYRLVPEHPCREGVGIESDERAWSRLESLTGQLRGSLMFRLCSDDN